MENQKELAEFITAHGLKFQYQDNVFWNSVLNYANPFDLIKQKCVIRITPGQLSPFGLPPGYEPHNPAALSADCITESGEYRAWTTLESSLVDEDSPWRKEIERWIEDRGNWDDTRWRGAVEYFTYRVPAYYPLPPLPDKVEETPKTASMPDLVIERDELSRVKEQLRAAQEAAYQGQKYGEEVELLKAEIESLRQQIAQASTIGELRPLSEMRETVPDGCDTITGYPLHSGFWTLGKGVDRLDTHFVLIRLPKDETPKDPFDVWWASEGRAGKNKSECRAAFNAGKESKS